MIDKSGMSITTHSCTSSRKTFTGHGAIEDYRYGLILVILFLILGSEGSTLAGENDSKLASVIAEKRCKDAEAFMQADMSKQAGEKYQKILKDDNLLKQGVDLKCARDGLLAVARKYVNEGEARESSSDIKGAEESYQSAINASGDYSEAHKRLMQLRRNKTVRYVTALRNLGFEDEALKEFNIALKDDPTFDKYEDIIDYITRPRVPLWTYLRVAKVQDISPQWVWRKMPGAVATMPIIETGILLFIIWLVGRKFLWGSPTLAVKDFSTDDADKSVGTNFRSMVEHNLIDFNKSTGANRGVFMVTGPISPVAVDMSATPLPLSWKNWTAVVQKLLSWLLARRPLAVAGHVYDNDKKKGVAIQLESGSRIVTKHIIWANDFGLSTSSTTEPWEDLADCAAIWTKFALHQRPVPLFPRFWAFLKRTAGSYRKILGTQYWESYAWFSLGDRRYSRDELPSAETAYLKALNYDPLFDASRVNLAGIYHLLEDENGPRLKAALEQLATVGPKKMSQIFFGITDPSLYAGSFRRAAIYFDLSEAEEANAEKCISGARGASVEMLCWIEKALKYRRFNDDLKKYLEWRKPIAECMKIGLEAANLKLSRQENKVQDLEKELERITRALTIKADFYSLYNLACTYALFSAVQSEKYTKQSLEYLRRSIKLSAHMENDAKVKLRTRRALKDAAFKHLRENDEFKKITKMGEEAKLDINEP